ncbi:MAG: flippase [Chloroflexi bacterium]|nr:flippase [Chloroflexota bacterium]
MRKFLRNLGFLTIGKITGDAFLFLYFLVLSRLFGTEGVGHYSFAMALTGFFAIIADFGFYSFSIKELSQRYDSLEEYSNIIVSLRLFLSALVFVILLAVAPFLPLSYEARIILVLIGSAQLIIRGVIGFAAFFIARGEMHLAGILEGSVWAVSAIVGIAVALSGATLATTIAVLPLSALFHLLVAYSLVTKKHGRIKLVLSPASLMKVWREATPYGISLLLFQLNSRTDVVLLGFFLGASAAGLYNVAYRIVFLLVYIPHFVGIALFPLISKMYLRSKEDTEALYHRVLNTAILVCVPAVFGLWLTAPDVILLFGDDFAESATILRILAGMLFFTSLNRLIAIFLMSCGKQVARTRSQWIAVLINVSGNILLIPMMGVKGAAVAAMVSEGLLCFLYAMKLSETLGWPRVGLRLGISSLAAISFFTPLVFFPSRSIYITIPFAIMVYLTVLVLFKDIRANELRIALGALKKGSSDARQRLRQSH